MNIRRAQHHDLPKIASLFFQAYHQHEQGLGYPRFESGDELLAELNLYKTTLVEAFWAISFNGEVRGTVGLLASQGDDEGYLVAPVFEEAFRTHNNVLTAIKHIEQKACFRGIRTLMASIALENEVLAAALEAHGYEASKQYLEMQLRTADFIFKPPTCDVVRASDIGTLEAAERILGWDDRPDDNLAEHLEEGYLVAVIRDGNQVLACVLWIVVQGTEFGRIENIAVAPGARRQGLASCLVQHVVDSARKAGIKNLFLSLDPGNHAAYTLYRTHGFFETLHSVFYEKDLLT